MPPLEQTEQSESSPAAEHKGPALRSDFAWTFLGNGIYAACQWAIVVVLAKVGTPELVGHYSFAVAVATPIVTFATLQLRSVQVSDVHEENRLGDYFGFRLMSMAVALLILTTVCVALRYSAARTALVEVVGLALVVEAVSDILYGQMQIRLRMDRIAKSMMVRAVLSIGVLLGVMTMTRNLFAAIFAMVLVRLAVLMVYDLPVARRNGEGSLTPVRPRFHWTVHKALLQFAFPVGLVSVLVALNTSIPRYFIQWSMGPRELGIFAALTFFQSSGNMVVGALGQAAFGRLATSFAKQRIDAFSRLLGQLLLVGIVLGVLGIAVSWLWGKQILEIFFRPEYAVQSDLLTYLMFAASMGYLCQFVGYGVTAARIFKPQIPLFVVVAATLLLASYLLVPRAGVAGAITAILIAGVVQLIGSFLLLGLSLRGKAALPWWRSRKPELAL
jgi:O-antigen/teichoic acid export membrane protein